MDFKKLALLCIFLTTVILATPISPEMARDVAEYHVELMSIMEPWENIGSVVTDISGIFDDKWDDPVGYVIDLSPSGYVVVSGNTDVRPVIAYSSETNFVIQDIPENIPLRIIRTDLSMRIEAIPFMAQSLRDRNNNLWREYIKPTGSISSLYSLSLNYGPYLDTQWNQGDPYNIFCPIDPGTGGLCPIGCVVTAMGQVVNFYEWPTHIAFGDSDSYSSGETTPPIWIDAPLANIDTIDYNGAGIHPDDTTKARFLYACGVAIKMKYADGGSMAHSESVAVALVNKFGYLSADCISPSSPGFYNDFAMDVFSNRTGILSLYADSVGHAIVVDGYRESGEFHVNYGWGGVADGWYFMPDSLPSGFTTATHGIVNVVPPVITHRPVVNLEATLFNGNYIYLRWTEPVGITEDVLLYNVYRRPVSDSVYNFIGSTTVLDFVDSTSNELTDYVYAVRADYGTAESRWTMVDIFSGIYNGWSRMIQRVGVEIPYSMAIRNDGGFVAAGYSDHPVSFDRDGFIISINFSGDTLWSKHYGGSGSDWINSIVRTFDGGYLIAGATDSYGAGGSDVWVLATDSLGDTLWSRTYGGPHDDEAKSALQTDDGGFILVGSSNDGTDDLLYILKLSSTGDTLWSKVYAGGYHGLTAADIAGCSGFLVAGYVEDGPYGNDDAVLMNFDDLGDTLWTRAYGGTNVDQFNDIAISSDSLIIMTGNTRSYGIPMFTSIYAVKTNLLGDTLWTNYFGGGMTNYTANGIDFRSDGRAVICGSISQSGVSNIYILYLDSDGDTTDTHIYGTVSNDMSYAVSSFPDSGIAIVGKTFKYGTNDFWLMKIGNEVYNDVQESNPDLPRQKQVLQAYPNPFNSSVNFVIRGVGTAKGRYAEVAIQIFDLSGRLVDNLRAPSTGNVEGVGVVEGPTPRTWFPDKSIGSGVYLARAFINGRVHTVKVIYLK